jgi:hypothetical protein
VEGKKETLNFSMHLSLFKIGDAPAFVTKERRVLVWHVFDYVSKGRHTLLGTCLLLAIKAGVSPIPYKGRRALAWRVFVSYPPYNA